MISFVDSITDVKFPFKLTRNDHLKFNEVNRNDKTIISIIEHIVEEKQVKRTNHYKNPLGCLYALLQHHNVQFNTFQMSIILNKMCDV